MIAFSTVQPTLTLEEFLALSETKPYAEYLVDADLIGARTF